MKLQLPFAFNATIFNICDTYSFTITYIYSLHTFVLHVTKIEIWRLFVIWLVTLEFGYQSSLWISSGLAKYFGPVCYILEPSYWLLDFWFNWAIFTLVSWFFACFWICWFIVNSNCIWNSICFLNYFCYLIRFLDYGL